MCEIGKMDESYVVGGFRPRALLFGFGEALHRAKSQDCYVRRTSWTKNVFIYAGDVDEDNPRLGLIMDGEEWLPTAADLFANNWEEQPKIVFACTPSIEVPIQL